MAKLPDDTKKLRARLRRYEQQLRQEYAQFGGYDDSAGLRYEVGQLYLLVGDLPGALQSFAWFEQAFPDDGGEPLHHLCWTLALFRSGNRAAAAQRLRETMLANLYLIPHLLDMHQDRLDIAHGSNWAEPEYVQYASAEILALWDAPAREWAHATYQSPEFQQVRARYIEIFRQLEHEPPGPQRSRLVNEAFQLKGFDADAPPS